MKPRFHSSARSTPEETSGLRVPYGPGKRPTLRWRRPLLVLLAALPLLVLGAPRLSGVITAPGTVMARHFELRATSPGFVAAIDVRPGDAVTPGQRLVELADPALEEQAVQLDAKTRVASRVPGGPALERLLAEQVALQARVLESRRARHRTIQMLVERGAATVAELDLAREHLAQAEATLASARADLVAARARVSGAAALTASPLEVERALLDHRRTQMSQRTGAPGRVVDIYVQEGEFVSAGTSLLLVAADEDPTIVAYLEPKDARGVRRGDAATVRFPDGSTLGARVAQPPAVAKRMPPEIGGVLGERLTAVLVSLAPDAPLLERYRIDGLPVTVRLHPEGRSWWG